MSILDNNKKQIRMKAPKALPKKLADLQQYVGGDGSLTFETEFNER